MKYGHKFIVELQELILLLSFCALAVGFVWLISPDSIRYALQYSTTTKDVFIDPKPHDCDFLTAPLGIKDCRYKKEVTAVKWHPDPNRFYFKSKVEGPNHSDAFASIPGEKIEDTNTKVYVTWTKMEGDE